MSPAELVGDGTLPPEVKWEFSFMHPDLLAANCVLAERLYLER
jgi:hypothetical protein